MAKQIIGIGAAPNDGTGDCIRDAFDKVNDNTTELYDGVWYAVPATKTSAGTAGHMAKDANFIYICETTGTEGNAAWTRIAKASNW